MAGGVKKWFMLWMWRVQQVSQPLTLTLMAVNLSLTIFGLIKWRTDSLLSISYIGVTMIMMLLVLAILSVALVWDLRLKMWRDQATVLVEKNPYNREKMSSKEILLYAITWLPVMDRLGRDDPVLRANAKAMRVWMSNILKEDETLRKDFEELKPILGDIPSQLSEIK